MAMMMAGRVLLVCALCVLWCGAGGGFGEETAGRGSGADLPLESKGLVTSPESSQGLQGGAPGGEGNLTPVVIHEADDDDDNGKTKAEKEKINERQSVQGGTIAIGSDSREKILSGSGKKTGQPILSAKGISPSGSLESNANPTQPEVEGTNTEENTPAAGNPLTTVNGEQTVPEGVAGVNLPSPPEEGVDSHEQSGEDTTSEGEKNVPSPETTATPQSHRDEGSEGTGEDTKATTVTPNTTDATNTQSSDDSTAAAAAVQPEDGMESNPAKNDLSPPSTEVAIQLSTAPDAEGASNSEENTKSQSAGNPNVTIATATQTNHTTKPGDSDGSTAVSHTTSPLLLLLVVACAAAAAVVAA
ncbi:Mucin-associated surface protein (MASP) [Trypanosoma cruzi]|uniref:Mucin-associated surface protein (MASP), putative n=2 Tax=Trypanosoma cruzi TaxID=5693 RepID=Q4E198_TRYCC|nr:mucin-associated surface protein (MASP), putative [Trypanosoma cruzi]EAN98534.1 mucin-associated surface protein (MASP), putative [Trypanosoma cruzi]PWV17852.1 Mucin-associated surface protein (MASP) [Trypanosoma cruzi]|eukprot:XP_820385.1 mucin-associated surface protein (MASP) [Trypanosoma cruzi strain CL Brener]